MISVERVQHHNDFRSCFVLNPITTFTPVFHTKRRMDGQKWWCPITFGQWEQTGAVH